MENISILKGVKVSAQKARLVINSIRGMNAEDAIDILHFTKKKSAYIIKKIIESAIANAEHNNSADIDNLKISFASVDKSRSLKRFSERAKGRGNKIEKQTCHITIKLK